MIGKKLKRAAKKITMPGGLKERILEKCDTETAENTEEITFTVEPFRPHRMRRIISGTAAAIFAVGIACYAGHLISRDGMPAGTETSTEITADNIIIPFKNIGGRQIKFNGYRGIIPPGELDETQSQKIADFFRTVEWQSIPSDAPETLTDSAYAGGVNDMDFYCETGNPAEYVSVYLDRGVVSYSIDEYENGQLVSGHNYYYKINADAFRDGIISLLYGSNDINPPFDISAVNFYTSALDKRQLTEDETAIIADAFRGWDWSHEVNNKPDGEPEYIFTDGNSVEIAVYENDTVVFWNSGESHVYENISGTHGIFCLHLKLLFDEYAAAYEKFNFPFGDFTVKEYSFNGEVIPEKKRIQIAKSFSNYVWHRLYTQEGYMGGIAYQFTAGDDCLTVYRDGVLECRTAENTAYYEINFEEVNRNFSDILYSSEFMPFAENDGCTVNFSGYRNFIPECELSETQAEKMAEFFSSLQWYEISKPDITGRFYPANDTVSFTKEKDGFTYTLSFSMNDLNLAVYSVYGVIPLENGRSQQYSETKYFSINENLIREAIGMNLADGADMYTPFGTLYKMTDSLKCESELYTGEISGDKLKSLSTAFLGWDWSNASYTIIEGTPEYTFSCEDFTVYVFESGTVVWDGTESAGEPPTYVCYSDVDGTDDPKRAAGSLCLMIEEILTGNNPVMKIQ